MDPDKTIKSLLDRQEVTGSNPVVPPRSKSHREMAFVIWDDIEACFSYR